MSGGQELDAKNSTPVEVEVSVDVAQFKSIVDLQLSQITALSIANPEPRTVQCNERTSPIIDARPESTRIQSIAGIEEATSLQTLDLAGALAPAVDLTEISKLTKLTKLKLSYNGILDSQLGFLKETTAIERIDLSSNCLASAEGVAGLIVSGHVSYIDLSGNQIPELDSLITLLDASGKEWGLPAEDESSNHVLLKIYGNPMSQDQMTSAAGELGRYGISVVTTSAMYTLSW